MSLLQKHPQWAAVCTIYQTLRSQGYQALLAGGCVRDALIGVAPQDLDLATNASPDAVEALFDKTVSVGKSFGVIRVLVEGADIEVATFRTDGDYIDGRHPACVTFSTAEEDALRRDFTINALFMDPGIEFILDFIEGQKDICARVIRTVGIAEQRFKEDHLRILRAVRFSGQLGFTIESSTMKAIQKMATAVQSVSAERRFEEMSKLLRTPFRDRALANLQTSGLMQVMFPFRKNDISFLAVPTGKNWQIWSLFFLPLRTQIDGLLTLKKHLQELKFSNKDKHDILQSFGFLCDIEKLLKESFGQKLLNYSQENFRWACQILVFTKSSYQHSIEGLHQNWLHLNETLPEPFLSGHDVAGKLKGREIGERLHEAFVMQLEGEIVSREEALNFIERCRT